MSYYGTVTINSNECIGTSLSTINFNAALFDTTLKTLSSLISNKGPTFITPVPLLAIMPLTQSTTISTVNVSAYVPANTSTILLQLTGQVNRPDDQIPDIYLVRASSLIPNNWYVLGSLMAAGGGDYVAVSNQGSFPISVNQTFDIQHTYKSGIIGSTIPTVVSIIGYY